MTLSLALSQSLPARRGRLPFNPASLFSQGEEGVLFDPSDLSSMYQGRTGTTAAAVGSPVGQLLDKSGNGNHAIAPSDAARPVLRQTAGGLYYLEFDGVDDQLQIADDGGELDVGTGEFIGAFGLLVSNSGQFEVVAGKGTNVSADNIRMFLNQANPSPLLLFTGSDAQASSQSLITINRDHNAVIAFGRSSGNDLYRVDGVTDVRPIGGVGTNDNSLPFCIGADSLAYFASMRLYAMCFRKGSYPSSVELKNLDRWLASKAGVAL